jgi:hypothetical protein
MARFISGTSLNAAFSVAPGPRELPGVRLSYPGHGGAAVTAPPGHVIMNGKGFQLKVDARTLDVTITVTGHGSNA